MSDALRRLLGLEQRATPDDRHPADESDDQASVVRAPELAPGEVRLRSGVSVAVVTFRVLLVAVAVLLGLLLLYLLRELVLISIVALVIGAAMHAPVDILERRGLPRPLAILASYGALLGVFIGAAVIIGGPLVAQAQALFTDLPDLASDLRRQAISFVDGFAGEGRGEDLLTWLEGALSEVELAPLIQLPLQAAGALVNVVIILFLSAFFLFERDRARDWLIGLLPAERRQPMVRLSRSVLHSLARFVQGQLMLMTIVGVGMTVALLVLDVPFALPLGLFAFIAEAIPMVGPWLAIVPAVAVALTESPEQAALLMGFWFVLQQVESYILTPAVMGHVQHLPPSVVLLSVLAGFQLFGLFGAIIAVPVTAALAMIVDAVFVRPRREALAGPAPPPPTPPPRQHEAGAS